MRLIDADDFIEKLANVPMVQEAIRKALDQMSTIDAVEVVRCKDCKHRQVNEHYGEEDYLNLKAMCDLDTGDPFELGRNAWNDDWFCADGERKTNG